MQSVFCCCLNKKKSKLLWPLHKYNFKINDESNWTNYVISFKFSFFLPIFFYFCCSFVSFVGFFFSFSSVFETMRFFFCLRKEKVDQYMNCFHYKTTTHNVCPLLIILFWLFFLVLFCMDVFICMHSTICDCTFSVLFFQMFRFQCQTSCSCIIYVCVYRVCVFFMHQGSTNKLSALLFSFVQTFLIYDHCVFVFVSISLI